MSIKDGQKAFTRADIDELRYAANELRVFADEAPEPRFDAKESASALEAIAAKIEALLSPDGS